MVTKEEYLARRSNPVSKGHHYTVEAGEFMRKLCEEARERECAQILVAYDHCLMPDDFRVYVDRNIRQAGMMDSRLKEPCTVPVRVEPGVHTVVFRERDSRKPDRRESNTLSVEIGPHQRVRLRAGCVNGDLLLQYVCVEDLPADGLREDDLSRPEAVSPPTAALADAAPPERSAVRRVKLIRTDGPWLEAIVQYGDRRLCVMDGFSVDERAAPRVGGEFDVEFSVLPGDGEEWEEMFRGNPHRRRDIEPISGWSYRAFGRVVGIHPVTIDCGVLTVEGVIHTNDTRVIGEFMAFTIQRLDAAPPLSGRGSSTSSPL